MLARAFQDDEFFVYLFPSEAEREKKLPCVLECFVRCGVLYGEVYATSANLEGVAVWVAPGKNELTLWRQIRSGLIGLAFKLGWKGISGAQSAMNHMSSVHRRHASFPHWYLFAIGVKPKFQGKGHASTLLKAMFARIDQEHLPCYLETNSEKSLPIYQHYGFKVVEDAIIPGTKVRQWAMVREKAP